MSEARKKIKVCPFCGDLNAPEAEVCGYCRRPLAKAEVVEVGDKNSPSSTEFSLLIERIGQSDDGALPAKEIPRLELESPSDVISRATYQPEKTVVEKSKRKERSGDADFKLLNLTSSNFKGTTGYPSSPTAASDLLQSPRDDAINTYEKTMKEKRVELDRQRRKELEYWRKVRIIEQIVIFSTRVVPWFILASVVVFILVPVASTLFPQGTWEGRVYDQTGTVTFKAILAREGAQLNGTLYFSKYVGNIPFVLEGVWDGESPLKVRGTFKLRSISLVAYPGESEIRKFILEGTWKGDRVSGEARNFWGVTANWDMEKL